MKIMALFFFLMLTSCATIHVETFNKTTGQKECEAHYTTLFKSLEGVKMQACHAKGEAATSTGDVEAIKAAVSAMMNVLTVMPK